MKYKIIITSLLLFFCHNNNFAQTSGTQDSIQARGFASFLMEQGLYTMAGEEYEKLTYLYPKDPYYARQLLKAYRLDGNYNRAIERARFLDITSPKVATEYIVSLILNEQNESAEIMINSSANLFSQKELLRFRTENNIIKGNYHQAQINFQENQSYPQQYKDLLQESTKLKTKSPALAGIMSALIPGTGRLYTRDYKDGLISLIFVGGAGYQSYTRFRKNGINSVGGWIYGALATGFYLANIYGSAKSAKYFNSKQRNKINAKAKTIIDRFYLD